MAASETRDQGEILDGRYRLVVRLGRGGFGDVWRAEELLPDGEVLREVALKLLHPGVLGVADWSAEARIIASLRHPALVTVYAAGLLEVERSIPFVAMELLLGESLNGFVDRGERVPWRRVLSWARQAAAALDEIHRAGVVHLDLKPANLFLPEHGGLKVLDFGIARTGAARNPVAAPDVPADDLSTAAFMVEREQAADGLPTVVGATSHSVVGTPGFMAPEIFEDGEATPASDAYALAGVIVQLATGMLPQKVGSRPATTASTTVGAWYAEVQAATVRGHIRDLSHDHPELPAALVRLLMRWLSLDPVQRGVERGNMRASLDEVWRCPGGVIGNPYRGLMSYRVEDDGKLFGRDADVARIARELCDQPCVIMQGEGGVGLESLALAGVVPALAKRFADERHDWVSSQVSFDGDASPDEALARALDAQLSEPADDIVVALERHVADAVTGVVVVLDDMHRVIDGDAEARADVARLLTRVGAGVPGLRVLGILRAEHTGELLACPDLGDAVRPWLRYISPLQASMVDEIVAGPARAAGRALSGGDHIAKALQLELGADGMRLGLTSLALMRWWDACGDDALSADVWKERGGVAGFLRQHADAVFESLEPDERALGDQLLLRLVTADGTPIEVAASDLLEMGSAPSRMRRVMDQLVAARLVIHTAGRVRIGHPDLALRWPRLHDLRLHDMDRLTFLEELRAAARRWTNAGRARAQVWTAESMAELDRRHDTVVDDLGDDERAFIHASRRAVRTSMIVRAVAVVFVLAVVALVAWLDRRMEWRAREQSEQLAAERARAAVDRMVTRSRRTPDPYVRVALLKAAIAAGSADRLLSLELTLATRDLPSARFLTLEPIPRPAFPWGQRWLIGGAGNKATVFDFDPPAGADFAPVVSHFRPHLTGMYDFVPFVFDQALVTRGLDGELKVWRLDEEGRIALAAVSPMKCLRGLSPVLVARRAPVIACTTDRGVALWDLRRVTEVVTDPFAGRGLHLSDDGKWLAASRLSKVLLWNAAEGKRSEIDAASPVTVARFSPRDPLVALVRGRAFDIVALGAEPRVILARETGLKVPTSARWLERGVDLAVCSYSDRSELHYLLAGERAEGDAQPTPADVSCERDDYPWPVRLNHVSEYADLAQARVGPRELERGWRLKNGQLLTRDLVVFDGKKDLRALVMREDATPEGGDLGESVSMVVRDGSDVVWQVGDAIRMHDASGKPILTRPGRLLARCPDGRMLSYRKDDAAWQLFGARHEVSLRKIAREPAFVVGAEPSCERVFFQRHDGTLTSVAVDGGGVATMTPVPLPGGSWVAEGYVFDARPSAGDAETPAGLWLALSEGALVRVDARGHVEAYGSATPRASAMADGPERGDLLFADDAGVVLRRRDVPDVRVLDARVDRVWTDMAMIDGSNHALLAWPHGVALLDLERREIVGELDTHAHGRLARWDDDGSVLVWADAFMGQPIGQVIPFGRNLASAIGDAASNLRAVLGPDMSPTITAKN